MKFLRLVLLSFRALKENPFRSFLTVLGVLIGVFIVITTVSMGEGAKNFIYDQITSFGIGANTLAIYGAPETERRVFGVFAAMTKSSITVKDIEAIREKISEIKAVAPAIMAAGEFKYGGKTYETSFLVGTTEDYKYLVKDIVSLGRFINQTDVSNRKRVVVLGQKLKEELFGVFPAVGEEVKLNGVTFRVIGIAKEMSSIFGMDLNEMCCIPLTTAEDLLNISEIMETWVVVEEVEKVKRAREAIEKLLLLRHGKKDFQIRIATETIKRIENTMNVLTLVISVIAAISLIVGSVGIMNVMLVAVTERTHEIGIRKSVGARRFDIFIQFLFEAIMVALVGGIAGIGLSALVLLIVGIFLGLTFVPSLGAIVIGFVASTVVGIVSGVYPAVSAAKLDPVEALRI